MSARWFPDSMPSPAATARTQPFWEAARRHRMTVLRCASCRAFRHPPRPICPYCRSFEAAWEQVPGSGTLFSYTVVHTPFHPSVREVVPYVIAVIELDGTDGTRFLSNLVDAPLEALHTGLPVEVVWEDMSEQLTVPRFRLHHASA